MRSRLIAALLLASATAVPAYAQEHDHGGQDGGGRHQDGGQDNGGQRGGGQGGQHQGGGGRQGGNPGGGPGLRGQPQQQQVRPNGGDLSQQGRGPGGLRPPQDFNGGDRGQATTDHRGGGDPRRFSGRRDGGVQVWQGQPGGRDDQARPPVNGVPHGDWNGRRHDGNGQYGGQPGGWNGGRPNGGPGWNGGRPDNAHNRNGDRYAAGGDWNRGWRQDRRYDWQGWRSQHRETYRLGRYRPPYGAGRGYRNYGIGYQIEPIFYAQDYWIDNPDYYRLPPAYGPYRWVRYYNDALLVDLEDGEVVDAIPNFFY